MVKKKKPVKPKESREEKTKALAPEVVESGEEYPLALTMDGTAHTEISTMQNIEYSRQIIQGARTVFNLARLRELKEKGKNRFLREGERQIFKLWHTIEALDTHNTLFVTLSLIAIGEVLNEVKSFLKPHEFARWRRDTFGVKHERYLQQSQQLAAMGDFAKQNASLGKRRLLALDHLRKSGFLRLPDNVAEQDPFPDTTEDFDGDIVKEHADGIVTYYRLREAGIDFVSSDQAALIAAYNKDALGVKSAKKIHDWLEKKEGVEEKQRWFDILVMNKMKFPEDHPGSPVALESLNKILADFVYYCRQANLDDQGWVEAQKQTLDEDIFLQSYQFIEELGRKFGIDLSSTQRSDA